MILFIFFDLLYTALTLNLVTTGSNQIMIHYFMATYIHYIRDGSKVGPMGPWTHSSLLMELYQNNDFKITDPLFQGSNCSSISHSNVVSLYVSLFPMLYDIAA